MSSNPALKANLRIILRHLNKLPSNGVNSFKAQTLGQFRANLDLSDKEEARALRWKVDDAARLIMGLRVRKDLLDLHAGEKMTQEERVKLTALRVGLNTPELYGADSSGERNDAGEAHEALPGTARP